MSLNRRLPNPPIYLDYMATTPMDPRVAHKMTQCMQFDGIFGNPASLTHSYGLIAAKAVEEARAQIATTIGSSPEALVFTSGATEANNLAILGAARFYKRKGMHVITMQTEHKAVLDSFHQLEQEGFLVTYLPPMADGLLDLGLLEQALRADTILVSIMQVNNETGILLDIGAIGELLSHKGIIFHVDAAQAAGKVSIDLQKLPVDLMSFSAHKNYGPKGIGALYVRQKPRIRLQPISFGGGQERGLRAGTLPTHQIVGMGEAFAIAEDIRPLEQAQILAKRLRLWECIRDLPGVSLNGHPDKRIAGNLNLSFAGIQPDSLLLALRDLAISRTSACASLSGGPSYVLTAMGLPDGLAFSSVRITVGRFTSDKDIDLAIDIIRNQVLRLYAMLPL